jgi:hypothetical protein
VCLQVGRRGRNRLFICAPGGGLLPAHDMVSLSRFWYVLEGELRVAEGPVSPPEDHAGAGALPYRHADSLAPTLAEYEAAAAIMVAAGGTDRTVRAGELVGGVIALPCNTCGTDVCSPGSCGPGPCRPYCARCD